MSVKIVESTTTVIWAKDSLRITAVNFEEIAADDENINIDHFQDFGRRKQHC
jgi:hypothetical protein